MFSDFMCQVVVRNLDGRSCFFRRRRRMCFHERFNHAHDIEKRERLNKSTIPLREDSKAY